ncbi:unnamed protein product [Penicillium salamii]|uniref:Uncharacterized protein n=1 Tax=Penicillium salamii TaxID=1612424 RepID=A0A9W4ISR0_9EURO|nr:unnamed protein product [Penicillium salamii]
MTCIGGLASMPTYTDLPTMSQALIFVPQTLQIAISHILHFDLSSPSHLSPLGH